MPNTAKVKAMRRALQIAKRDYDAGCNTASIIAYLSAIVRAQTPTRPVYVQLPMFAIPGRLTGKLKCKQCEHTFGDTDVSPRENWKMYLITPCCPHCGHGDYTDNGQ